MLLDGQLQSGQTVHVGVRAGQLRFEVTGTPAEKVDAGGNGRRAQPRDHRDEEREVPAGEPATTS